MFVSFFRCKTNKINASQVTVDVEIYKSNGFNSLNYVATDLDYEFRLDQSLYPRQMIGTATRKDNEMVTVTLHNPAPHFKLTIDGVTAIIVRDDELDYYRYVYGYSHVTGVELRGQTSVTGVEGLLFFLPLNVKTNKSYYTAKVLNLTNMTPVGFIFGNPVDVLSHNAKKYCGPTVFYSTAIIDQSACSNGDQLKIYLDIDSTTYVVFGTYNNGITVTDNNFTVPIGSVLESSCKANFAAVTYRKK